MRASVVRGRTEGRRPELVAHGLLTLVAILWGSSFVGVKLAVAEIPPLTLGFVRAVLAALALAAYAAASGVRLRLPRRDLVLLTILGALGIGWFYVGTNLGIQLASATNAALLNLPAPALAAVGAWLFLEERIGPARVAGVAIALGGAIFLTVRTAQEAAGGVLAGNLFLLSAMFAWTAYTLLGRRWLGRWAPAASVAWIMITGALVLAPAAAVELAVDGLPRVSAQGLLVTLYLGLGCTALAYVIWNHGLAVLGATRTAVYLYLLPVVTVAVAIPVLGERPSVDVLAAGLVVLAGTYLVARR